MNIPHYSGQRKEWIWYGDWYYLQRGLSQYRYVPLVVLQTWESVGINAKLRW